MALWGFSIQTADCASVDFIALRQIRLAIERNLYGERTLRNLVPAVGIELTTYRLQGGCSTTELSRRSVYST
jgi:hypothetical protein